MARNPHPEVTERRILAAAKKLFAEKGYDKTSIQDIIDKLGDLSRGAIYHHFKSKEAILERLNTDDWHASQALCDEIAKRDDMNAMESSARCSPTRWETPRTWRSSRPPCRSSTIPPHSPPTCDSGQPSCRKTSIH